MTHQSGGFRAPDVNLPPARFLTSARIGAWLGTLRRLPELSGAMRMWMWDAKRQLDWREHAVPRVITTAVKKRDGTPLTFSIDDSLSDVETRPTPAFNAWKRWLETGEVDEER